MISIAIFGALFTWLMIFITHIHFRRRHLEGAAAFRMWGAPWTSAAGALLVVAILVTTLFTDEFRMTLVYGLPLLALLSGLYAWSYGLGDSSNQVGEGDGVALRRGAARQSVV